MGRAVDVFRFAAIEALRDDGEAFAGDVSAHGRDRRAHTLREPVRLVAAITPFNHPLNQVAHKVAPAIAAGAPIVLKPSEKTPLTRCALLGACSSTPGCPPSGARIVVRRPARDPRRVARAPRGRGDLVHRRRRGRQADRRSGSATGAPCSSSAATTR